MNKKMKIITAVAAPLLLFTGCVGGVGIGSSSDDGTAAASEPAPTETVTATPEPAPTVTETPEPVIETVTEEVEVVPQACLDALDAGDETFDLLTQAIFAASDALGGASRMDPFAIDAATAEIDELTPQVEDSSFDWGFNSAACRDGA